MNKIYEQIDYIRKQFLILQDVNKYNQQLVFMDNAASTQKPIAVIDSISDFYTHFNCNIHRGKYELSHVASDMFDTSRSIVAKQINADAKSVLFTSGATESLNFVANIFQRTLKSGNVVLVSEMEHTSNFVPFQMACKATGATFLPIPITDKGDINMAEYQKLLAQYGKRIKLISVTHISNAIGTINPIELMIQHAHYYDIPVCVDAAQSIAHAKIDVKKINCDFLAFSGHKAFAPFGIGVLYISEKHINSVQPYQYGGGMITEVSYKESKWKEAPEKFEAGTPNVEGAIALGVAFEFINKIGIVNIYNYERQLTEYCISKLKEIPSVTIIGDPKERAGIVSFTFKGYKSNEVCETLSAFNICVRSGYLCALPLMKRLNLPDGVVRISFSVFNTFDEIDKLIYVLKNIKGK